MGKTNGANGREEAVVLVSFLILVVLVIVALVVLVPNLTGQLISFIRRRFSPLRVAEHDSSHGPPWRRLRRTGRGRAEGILRLLPRSTSYQELVA